jgi:hypothetical protein
LFGNSGNQCAAWLSQTANLNTMKNPIRTLFCAALLSAAALLSSGCFAVAVAGAAGATVAYVRGTLETNLDHPVGALADAAQKAVEKMKFVVVSNRADVLSGEVIARTADDTKVSIKLKKMTDQTTHVSIRVGVFGDQAVSMQLLDDIKQHL